MPTQEPLSLEEAFDGLPDEIRTAIDGVNWQDKLRRIAGARSLRVDQGAALEDETLRFMTGHQSVEEYAVHLSQELKLPTSDFQSLIAELEREIFQPIQDKIRASLQPAPKETAVASSVGAGEEDDLEALLNEGEDALAEVASNAPKHEAPVASVAAAPFVPPIAPPTASPAESAPPNTAAKPSLSTAAQKLAEPVTKPAEEIPANLQKPKATFQPPAPSADPYRETI